MKTRRVSVRDRVPPPTKVGAKDPADWDKWVTHRHLRRELSCGSTLVYELLKEAGIDHRTGEDGSKKYPPDTIDRIKPLLLDSDAEKPDVGSDLVVAASKLVKMSEEHNRQFVEVMVKPLTLALNTLETTITRLDARCAKLEDDRDKTAAAREDLLSEAAARAIAERSHVAQEARKDQAWGIVLNRAPMLLDQIQASIIGKKPEVQRKIAGAIELLGSMSTDQLTALRASGFLNEKQMGAVDQILAAINPPETKETKKEEKHGSNSH